MSDSVHSHFGLLLFHPSHRRYPVPHSRSRVLDTGYIAPGDRLVMREEPGPKTLAHADSWGASSHLLSFPSSSCTSSSIIPHFPVYRKTHLIKLCPTLCFSTLIDGICESLFLSLCDSTRENRPLGNSERANKKGNKQKYIESYDPATLEKIHFISSYFPFNGEREYKFEEDGQKDQFFPKVQAMHLNSVINCVTTSKSSTCLSLNVLISKMGLKNHPCFIELL